LSSPRERGERIKERGPLLIAASAPLPAACGRRPLPTSWGEVKIGAPNSINHITFTVAKD
jgi:hypothetical protein